MRIRNLVAAVVAGGALALAPALPAMADIGISGTGVLNGTQVYLPVNVPVNIVGNSIGVAGEANVSVD